MRSKLSRLHSSIQLLRVSHGRLPDGRRWSLNSRLNPTPIILRHLREISVDLRVWLRSRLHRALPGCLEWVLPRCLRGRFQRSRLPSQLRRSWLRNGRHNTSVLQPLPR
jgi:hypothetical protein